MEILDSQMHIGEETPAPGRAWIPFTGEFVWPGKGSIDYWPAERALAAMDAIGVDQGIIVSRFEYRDELPDGTFRYDNSYAEECVERFPGRFMTMTHIDHRIPDVEEVIAEMRSRPGTLGFRFAMGYGPGGLFEELAQGKLEPMLSAAEKHDVPMMFHTSWDLSAADQIARTHPGLSLLIDHIGIPMPPFLVADDDIWEHLPQLLSLARYPNVTVKVSRVPTLTESSYPFSDLWVGLHRIVDAFGPDRLIWGSDCTTLRGFHTYAETLLYLLYTPELSEGDKEKILGGSLRKWLRWPK